jgi:hypothetical protein
MVDVYGDFAVHYQQDKGDDQDAKIKVDDADFGFNFESAINEEMAIIANMDVTGEGALELDDLTVGFKAAGTTVKVGKQVNLVDEIGLSNDFAFGLDTAEDQVGLAASGDQVINVQYDSGEMLYAGFSTTAQVDTADKWTEAQEGSQYAVKVGARFADADVVAYYADGDLATYDVDTATVTADDAADSDVIALKGSYALNDVTLSAIYTAASQDDSDTDAYGANIEYSMDKVGFNLGAVDTDFEDKAKEDYTEFYANVSYAVAKNATAFFELSDNDKTGVDMGYAAGLTVSF